jgi:hypothetical protein
MRRVWLLFIVSGLLVPTLFAGSSFAHVKKIDTTLTIHRSPSGQVGSRDRVLVFGKLKPSRCRLGQTVTLFERTAGLADEVLGTDTLDGDGEYGIHFRPGSDMNVYTKVKSAVIVSNYEHSHRCKGDRSPQIHIEVS